MISSTNSFNIHFSNHTFRRDYRHLENGLSDILSGRKNKSDQTDEDKLNLYSKINKTNIIILSRGEEGISIFNKIKYQEDTDLCVFFLRDNTNMKNVLYYNMEPRSEFNLRDYLTLEEDDGYDPDLACLCTKEYESFDFPSESEKTKKKKKKRKKINSKNILELKPESKTLEYSDDYQLVDQKPIDKGFLKYLHNPNLRFVQYGKDWIYRVGIDENSNVNNLKLNASNNILFNYIFVGTKLYDSMRIGYISDYEYKMKMNSFDFISYKRFRPNDKYISDARDLLRINSEFEYDVNKFFEGVLEINKIFQDPFKKNLIRTNYQNYICLRNDFEIDSIFDLIFDLNDLTLKETKRLNFLLVYVYGTELDNKIVFFEELNKYIKIIKKMCLIWNDTINYFKSDLNYHKDNFMNIVIPNKEIHRYMNFFISDKIFSCNRYCSSIPSLFMSKVDSNFTVNNQHICTANCKKTHGPSYSLDLVIGSDLNVSDLNIVTDKQLENQLRYSGNISEIDKWVNTLVSNKNSLNRLNNSYSELEESFNSKEEKMIQFNRISGYIKKGEKMIERTLGNFKHFLFSIKKHIPEEKTFMYKYYSHFAANHCKDREMNNVLRELFRDINDTTPNSWNDLLQFKRKNVPKTPCLPEEMLDPTTYDSKWRSISVANREESELYSNISHCSKSVISYYYKKVYTFYLIMLYNSKKFVFPKTLNKMFDFKIRSKSITSLFIDVLIGSKKYSNNELFKSSFSQIKLYLYSVVLKNNLNLSVNISDLFSKLNYNSSVFQKIVSHDIEENLVSVFKDSKLDESLFSSFQKSLSFYRKKFLTISLNDYEVFNFNQILLEHPKSFFPSLYGKKESINQEFIVEIFRYLIDFHEPKNWNVLKNKYFSDELERLEIISKNLGFTNIDIPSDEDVQIILTILKNTLGKNLKILNNIFPEKIEESYNVYSKSKIYNSFSYKKLVDYLITFKYEGIDIVDSMDKYFKSKKMTSFYDFVLNFIKPNINKEVLNEVKLMNSYKVSGRDLYLSLDDNLKDNINLNDDMFILLGKIKSKISTSYLSNSIINDIMKLKKYILKNNVKNDLNEFENLLHECYSDDEDDDDEKVDFSNILNNFIDIITNSVYSNKIIKFFRDINTETVVDQKLLKKKLKTADKIIEKRNKNFIDTVINKIKWNKFAKFIEKTNFSNIRNKEKEKINNFILKLKYFIEDINSNVLLIKNSEINSVYTKKFKMLIYDGNKFSKSFKTKLLKYVEDFKSTTNFDCLIEKYDVIKKIINKLDDICNQDSFKLMNFTNHMDELDSLFEESNIISEGLYLMDEKFSKSLIKKLLSNDLNSIEVEFKTNQSKIVENFLRSFKSNITMECIKINNRTAFVWDNEKFKAVVYDVTNYNIKKKYDIVSIEIDFNKKGEIKMGNRNIIFGKTIKPSKRKKNGEWLATIEPVENLKDERTFKSNYDGYSKFNSVIKLAGKKSQIKGLKDFLLSQQIIVSNVHIISINDEDHDLVSYSFTKK